MEPLFGAVEAGGTKFVCAVGTRDGELRTVARFPTTTPEETLPQVIAFFSQSPEPIRALGVGSFGPLDLQPESPGYGTIRRTSKPGWSGTDIIAPFKQALGIPIALDTDVNAAGLGELLWGAGRGTSSLLYVTIGTGVGGGVIIDRMPVHGLVHPEMGHIRLPNIRPDGFPGICPFHGDCFEGLASGPALASRWGQPAETLGVDHAAWEIEAATIAAALHNLVCAFSPERIILGGGVMRQRQLFPLIRRKLLTSLNGYVQSAALLEEIDSYIVPPALGGRAGVLGALAMAASHSHFVRASERSERGDLE